MTERERFKEILSILNVTQSDFAKALGITQTDISKYINGKSKYLRSEIYKSIHDIYKVNLNWLIAGHGDVFTDGSNVEEPAAGYDSFKEECFALRKECNDKGNMIIKLMKKNK